MNISWFLYCEFKNYTLDLDRLHEGAHKQGTDQEVQSLPALFKTRSKQQQMPSAGNRQVWKLLISELTTTKHLSRSSSSHHTSQLTEQISYFWSTPWHGTRLWLEHGHFLLMRCGVWGGGAWYCWLITGRYWWGNPHSRGHKKWEKDFFFLLFNDVKNHASDFEDCEASQRLIL